MRVKNNGNRVVPTGRSFIPPGKEVDVPDGEMYRPRLAKLRARGVLQVVHPEKKVLELVTDVMAKSAPSVEVIEESVDALTELPFIGKSREKSLIDEGVLSFSDVVDRGVDWIAKTLAVDADTAIEIFEAAQEKMNG